MTRKQAQLAKQHGLEPEDFDTLHAVLGTVAGHRRRRKNWLVVEGGSDAFASMLRLEDAGAVYCQDQWEDVPNFFSHIWHATALGASFVGIDVHVGSRRSFKSRIVNRGAGPVHTSVLSPFVERI